MVTIPHAVLIGSMAVMTFACGGGEETTQAPPTDTVAGMSLRYVGCIGSTANPNIYVLSVIQPRDFSTGEPPGTPIPRKSRLPEGAPPPIPPVTVTSGTPGGGPTPTTEVVTYRLVGNHLGQYVGHTVEVVGRPERSSDEDDRSSAAERSELLYITSISDVADFCK